MTGWMSPEEQQFTHRQWREEHEKRQQQERLLILLERSSKQLVAIDETRAEIHYLTRWARWSRRTLIWCPFVFLAGVLLCLFEITQPLGVLMNVVSVIFFLAAGCVYAVMYDDSYDVTRLRQNLSNQRASYREDMNQIDRLT